MKEIEYFRGSFKSFRVEKNDTGEKTIVVSPLFGKNEVDYSNRDNVLALAYNSRKNANNLFELVMEKYKGENVAYISNFEMLIALIALSSELYMKTIIYYYQLNNNQKCKGHTLVELFNMLPESIKEEIKTIDVDFEQQLQIVNNYFIIFRYNFEYNILSGNFFAFNLAEILHEICNNLQIQAPPEVLCTHNRMLLKQGDETVWDSSKQHEYWDKRKKEKKIIIKSKLYKNHKLI